MQMKVKRSEEYKRQMMIYFGGYATWKPYTLSEWFAAQAYCKENKDMAYT